MEGGIPASVSSACKSRGERPSGDLVPWTLTSQFLDTHLSEFIGARIVRIATHPEYQVMLFLVCHYSVKTYKESLLLLVFITMAACCLT